MDKDAKKEEESGKGLFKLVGKLPALGESGSLFGNIKAEGLFSMNFKSQSTFEKKDENGASDAQTFLFGKAPEKSSLFGTSGLFSKP